MSNESPTRVQVEYTSEFKRNLRHLSKKYRHIKSDLQPIIEQLEAGQTPGVQVPGIGYTVFKVRIKNSDIKKGKRAGYRLIYYWKSVKSTILITIYAKTEQDDVSEKYIRQIIINFDNR